MHEKYAKQGVVCMSVSVDLKEDYEAALKFLQKQKATFANFLLDEKQKVWQDHFSIIGPPAVFVYDRDGKVTPFNNNDKEYTYADVEKLVKKLLESK
jgi:hypothetical protein